MTRDDVQQFIDDLRRTAANYRETSQLPHMPELLRARASSTEAAYLTIAQTLSEALDKSERPTSPKRVEVTISPTVAAQCGIRYGSRWHEQSAPFHDAGPGLWRCIGMGTKDGSMMVIMEQVTP